MLAEHRVVLAVACEDCGHYEAVTRLTDRRLAEEVPWAADILDSVRLWLGDGEKDWASITRAKTTAREFGLKPHGHFGPAAGGPEAKLLRAQLFVWMERRRQGTKIDAALLVRDLDRRDDRLEAMRLAIGCGTWPFAVVAVWCQPEVEGWAIGCFVASNDAERKCLAAICKRLSFCPVTEPDRMISAALNSIRDAKTIATELFADDELRRRSWFDLPFDELRKRGEKTGLADFLRQVDETLVPLFQRANK